MKPLQIVSLPSVFPHESTELYQRTRELHAYAAQLESRTGTSRYLGSLVHLAFLATLSTASAGVAASERMRGRHLSTLRDRLARFASTLRSIADCGLVDTDSLRFAGDLVAKTVGLIETFDAELRCVEAALLSEQKDVERERAGIGLAADEQVVEPTDEVLTPGDQTAASAAATTKKAPRRASNRSNQPANDESTAKDRSPQAGIEHAPGLRRASQR